MQRENQRKNSPTHSHTHTPHICPNCHRQSFWGNATFPPSVKSVWAGRVCWEKQGGKLKFTHNIQTSNVSQNITTSTLIPTESFQISCMCIVRLALIPRLACLVAAYSCQLQSKVSILSDNFRSVTCPVSVDSATTEDGVCKSMEVYQLEGIHVMPKLQTGHRR